MRIGLGYLLQETNSFSPLKARLEDFHLAVGRACVDRWRGTKTEIGGFFDCLAQTPHEAVPLFAGWAITEGPIEAEEFGRMQAIARGQLQEAGRLDALLLALHGAMSAEGDGDCEGVLLSAIRAGGEVPIVLTLDLHANVTRHMISLVNAVIGYRSYPHVDMYETGLAAGELLLRILRGEVRPVTVMQKLPLIVPAENMTTTSGPLAEVFRAGEACRRGDPRLLSVSAFGVQPWLDVEEMGCATVAVADGDRDLASVCARRMAERFWELRRQFEVQLLDPWQAIEEALATPGQPVILAEPSDSPTAGSPGDSVELLAALRDCAPGVPAALWVRDACVVEKAWQAGPGARVQASLGGRHDPANRRAVEIDAVVRSISDGRFFFTGGYNNGMAVEMGRTAVLDFGAISVVVSEKPVANIGVEVFRSQGVEPRDKKIVVVKSAAGFRSEYGPFAARILVVGTPGISSPNLRSLPYRRVPRPIYPLDETVFEPNSLEELP